MFKGKSLSSKISPKFSYKGEVLGIMTKPVEASKQAIIRVQNNLEEKTEHNEAYNWKNWDTSTIFVQLHFPGKSVVFRPL